MLFSLSVGGRHPLSQADLCVCVCVCVNDLGSLWDTGEDLARGNERSAVTDADQQMLESLRVQLWEPARS